MWTSKAFILKISIVIFERIMRRSEILQTLAIHRDDLIQMRVKTLAVFGSVARDEARLDSDVDILGEFQGPATFNGYMDLKFFLEEMLGRPVDLVTRKSMRPRLKTQIESEALYVQGLPAVSWGYADLLQEDIALHWGYRLWPVRRRRKNLRCDNSWSDNLGEAAKKFIL
jgi:predicted nucleotidyltransferase